MSGNQIHTVEDAHPPSTISHISYSGVNESTLREDQRQELQLSIYDLVVDAKSSITISNNQLLSDLTGPYKLEIAVNADQKITISFKNAADEILACKPINNETFYENLQNYKKSIVDYQDAVRKYESGIIEQKR